jgi:hypothetical protein
MGFRISGNTTSNVAEVTSNNQLQVTQPLTSTVAGFTALVAEGDHGTATGTRFMRELYSSLDRRLSVGLITPLFDYQFAYAAQDTNFWYYVFATMTATQTGNFFLLNSNSTATSTTGCYMRTWRYFKLMSSGQLHLSIYMNITSAALAGEMSELGFFVGTSTVAPADGAFFRYSSAGLMGVVTSNGTETADVLLVPILTPNVNYRLDIIVCQYNTEFYVNDVLAGNITTPIGNVQPFATAALPVCLQYRNTGAVGGGTQMQVKVGSVRVEQVDLQLGMPFSHIQGAYGMAYQTMPGVVPGQLSNYTNNAAPAAAVLNNTTTNVAALGGIALITASLVAGTDGLLFSYANAVGTNAYTPRTLVITGVSIQGVVTTAFTGGPSTNLYSIAFGHTATSLATPLTTSFTSPTTKAPKFIPIGMDTYASGAVVGVIGSTTPLFCDFSQAPICVNPTENVAIVARPLTGAPSPGVITVIASIRHYWI